MYCVFSAYLTLIDGIGIRYSLEQANFFLVFELFDGIAVDFFSWSFFSLLNQFKCQQHTYALNYLPSIQ